MIPDDFRGNLNPGIGSNISEILGIFIFLKYKFSGVIDELFGYNLYISGKEVIDFLINQGTPGIMEIVEKK